MTTMENRIAFDRRLQSLKRDYERTESTVWMAYDMAVSRAWIDHGPDRESTVALDSATNRAAAARDKQLSDAWEDYFANVVSSVAAMIRNHEALP